MNPASHRLSTRRSRGALAAISLLAMALPFCSGAPGVGEGADGPEVRDGLGRLVSISATPTRIVSLAPSVTESLIALGALEQLVGVTRFCEIPAGDHGIARIGGMLNPNLEAIRSLRPDLLIATTSGNDPSLQARAAGLGLPLYTLHTPDVEGVLSALRSLAKLIDREAEGDRLVAGLRRRLARVRLKVSKRRPPRVLFIVWTEPLIVPGRAAFLTDALLYAGAVSVTADAAGAHPAFNLESVVARAPEVIVTTEENRRLVEALPDDAAWQAVPAIARGRIHILGPAIVRPGPGVIKGIEELADYLHPAGAAEDAPGGGRAGTSTRTPESTTSRGRNGGKR